jgi:hypothetical protein
MRSIGVGVMKRGPRRGLWAHHPLQGEDKVKSAKVARFEFITLPDLQEYLRALHHQANDKHPYPHRIDKQVHSHRAA